MTKRYQIVSIACAAATVVFVAGCSKSDPRPPVVVKPPIDAASTVDARPPSVPRPPVTTDAITAASKGAGSGSAGPAVTPIGTTVDGNALREKHRARLAGDRTPVTVLTGGTPGELGAQLCEAVVPKRPPNTPVLVKPNLGGFNWFHDPKTHRGDDGVKGRITDPEFVRGIVKCLRARGHTAITIADGFTGKATDWNRLARISGYEAMAKQEGVKLVAIDDDGVFDKTGDLPGKPLAISGIDKTHVPTLLVAKLLAEHLDHGLYIAVPKLKTHRFSVFSVGIKAMQGNVMYSDASPAFHQKWRSHRELDGALAAIKKGEPNARATYVKALEIFAERMVDVLELEAPDVVLVEGTPAMDGDGFDELYPRAENVAIGGTNVILVDRVAAQYLGLWDNAALAKEIGGHRTSPLLEAAAKRFGIDITDPPLAGAGATVLATKQLAHLHGMAGFDLDEHDKPDEVVPDGATKDLHAPKLAGEPPKLDGVIDEAWAAATPLDFATDWAGKATSTTTHVRALWSSKGLFLLFELDGAGLFTDQGRPIFEERIDLYEEDCVEVMLAPVASERRRYFELEVGPFGHFFDLLVDRTGPKRTSDVRWSGGLQIGTKRDETNHRAVIEVAVTSPDAIAALVAGARLPIGIYRMEGKGPRQYLAAFPTRTPKPNFHVPDAFGTLVLDP